MKFITLCLFLLLGCYSAPINKNKKYVEKYLKKFGYLSKNEVKVKSNILSTAVIEFQNFAGLNMTGKIDDKLVDFMHLPRCGVKDLDGIEKQRFVLTSSKWDKNDLTFYIKDYTDHLDKAVVKSVIQKAFNIWSKYTDLTFNEVNQENNANFVLGFYKKKHYEGFGSNYGDFDGKGTVLAHAFAPPYGKVHFDGDENWSVLKDTDLYEVAAHEIGHALGLHHSENLNAIMSPFYTGYSDKFVTNLHEDDIAGITTLYGKRLTEIMKVDNSICNLKMINSIFIHNNNHYVITKDTLYLYNYVKWFVYKVNDYWNGLPENVKGFSFYGKIYLFSGDQYWRFNDRQIDGNYPIKISNGFVGIPNNIDAVMSWKSKAYFFKGNKYWVFDQNKNPRVMPTYPKLISDDVNGMPNNLNTIYYDPKQKFVFGIKNNTTYYFDVLRNNVTRIMPVRQFFNC